MWERPVILFEGEFVGGGFLESIVVQVDVVDAVRLRADGAFNTARARDPPEKGHFGRGGQHNLLGSYNHRYSGC